MEKEKLDATNVININGTDYTEDELSNEQKYFIQQIKDLQSRSNTLKFQMDQAQVCLNGFTNALIESLEKSEEDKAEAS
ncbi:MAG: hypothetical protein VW496_00280 [Pelagibacteraceae bacterium]